MNMPLFAQAESTPMNTPLCDLRYSLNYTGNQTIISADSTITNEEVERGRKEEWNRFMFPTVIYSKIINIK
jgi:hypothetical protein